MPSRNDQLYESFVGETFDSFIVVSISSHFDFVFWISNRPNSEKFTMKVLLFVPFLVAFAKPNQQLKEILVHKDWPSLRSQVISKAKSESELDRKLATVEALTRDHQTCEQQLKQRSFPLKCFDLLEREFQLGILKKDGLKQMTNFLDQVCEQTISDIKDIQDVRFAGLRKKTLSPKCRTLLAKRRDVLKYKASEEDPSAVFQSRWD